MTTRDVPTLLAEALHREAAAMPVTDSHQAVQRLERTVSAHRRRRLVLALAAAAVAVGVLVAGSALVMSDDRAEGPPAEKKEQAREVPPPGHRIVYAGHQRVLMVSDLGSKPLAVLAGSEPRFEPGGSRVAYIDAQGHLAAADVAGSTPWRSTRLDAPPAPRGDEGASALYGPVWSPDGARVAYMAASELRVVDVATGDVQTLREFRAPYVRPMDWTPDGASLVLGFDRSTTGGEMVVETFDLASRRLTPLLGGDGETTGVRFSPDGTQLAFWSDSRRCICVAAADGTGIRPVLRFEATGLVPDNARLAWSPDATTLVWEDRRSGQVSLLDLETGQNRRLAGGADLGAAIDWDRP